MNLARPSVVLFNYLQGAADQNHQNPHVPADIQNCYFPNTRHRLHLRPKGALSMFAILFSDKYGAYDFAVRSKDEKPTLGAREIHIIAFSTQSRLLSVLY
jgi:hypothetical protein